jgi:hypothetical protein
MACSQFWTLLPMMSIDTCIYLALLYNKQLKNPINQSAKPTPSPGKHCRENRCGVVESSLELHKGRDFQTVKFPSCQSIPDHA